MNGHVDTVAALIQRGAEANARNQFGQTALFVAAAKGHVDVVIALVDSGADVNIRNNDHASPILCAINFSHFNVACLLLRRGRAVLSAEEVDSMCLRASLDGAKDLLLLLIRRGADIYKSSMYNKTVLDLYCFMKDHLDENSLMTLSRHDDIAAQYRLDKAELVRAEFCQRNWERRKHFAVFLMTIQQSQDSSTIIKKDHVNFAQAFFCVAQIQIFVASYL
jgi:ankyrin repeat protein